LRTPPAGYNVKPLSDAITQGLEAANNAAIRIRYLKGQYEALPQDQQYIVRLYLAWLFIYGMWMRFWAGPGNPWPTEWVEYGGRGGLCEVGARDEHVFIQQGVRTALIETYERIPGLKDWIEALPLLDYDFRTGEVQIATGTKNTTIKSIVDHIQLGDFCLAHGSDLILKTSYYLIARLLNLTTEAEFNSFIDTIMPAVLDIERQVVAYQLAQIKNRTNARDKVRALESRAAQLAGPIPKQPPFNPTAVRRTGHTDPHNRINFGDQDNRWW
jgi:hypothetical protein